MRVRGRTKKMRLTALVMLIGVLSLVPMAASQAGATFDVDTTDDTSDADPGDGTCADAGDKCSLRAAVEEANALVGADTINVPLGDYHITSTILVSDPVTIIGAGKASTVLDLSGLPIFLATYDLDLSKVGFVGSITAIRTEAGVIGPTVNLTVDSVAFTGSGIAIQGDTIALITNSTFENGGIIVVGEEFNGAVNLTVRDSSFTGSAGSGFISSANLDTPVTVTITRSSFRNSGVKFLEAGSPLDVTVSRSTFSLSNGFNFRGTTLHIENSTLVDMSSQGIFAHSGTVTLNHVTVEGVVASEAFIGASVITLTNSIVTQVDSTDACETRDNGSIVSGGGNIATDGTCNLTATNDQANTDPLLGVLSDNGGPTLTRLPAVGSPAIDAALSGPCPGVDQRGETRPSGDLCDSGSVEVQQEPPATTTTAAPTTTTAAPTTTTAAPTTTVAPTSSTLPATGIGDAVRISAPLGLGLLLVGLLALGGAAVIGDRRRRQ